MQCQQLTHLEPFVQAGTGDLYVMLGPMLWVKRPLGWVLYRAIPGSCMMH